MGNAAAVAFCVGTQITRQVSPAPYQLLRPLMQLATHLVPRPELIHNVRTDNDTECIPARLDTESTVTVRSRAGRARASVAPCTNTDNAQPAMHLHSRSYGAPSPTVVRRHATPLRRQMARTLRSAAIVPASPAARSCHEPPAKGSLGCYKHAMWRL